MKNPDAWTEKAGKDYKDLDCCCSGCCGSAAEEGRDAEADRDRTLSQAFIIGSAATPAGDVPIVSAKLSSKDILGAWRVRWGIGRMSFSVQPGIYGVGSPDTNSPVFVTANYKMSFDRLRKELAGMNAWILALDTKGINVWCAAGKGTFGTDEIVSRIQITGLSRIVNHLTLILPQLGAPGVAAHEVKKRSGFRVIYGPVRASDIPAFLKAGMKAAPEMREVGFPLRDRLVLTSVELTTALSHPIILAFIAVFFLNLLGVKWISVDGLAVLGALLVGTVLTPLLLPWVPGRAFAFKGWLLGMAWALAVNIYRGVLFTPSLNWKHALANFLILPAISSFLAMNFTGSSTYTSLSGVVKEMKYALPAIILSAFLGVALMIASVFV